MSLPQPDGEHVTKLAAMIKQDQDEKLAELAFEELVQIYQNPIFNYTTYMTGNVEDGKDAAQTTFMNVWENRTSSQDPSKFRSWLYQIATNCAYEKLRKVRPQISWEQLNVNDSFDIGAGREHAQKAFDEALADREHFQQALMCVAPIQRACLLLHHQVGFPIKKIAYILETSPESVPHILLWAGAIVEANWDEKQIEKIKSRKFNFAPEHIAVHLQRAREQCIKAYKKLQ